MTAAKTKTDDTPTVRSEVALPRLLREYLIKLTAGANIHLTAHGLSPMTRSEVISSMLSNAVLPLPFCGEAEAPTFNRLDDKGLLHVVLDGQLNMADVIQLGKGGRHPEPELIMVDIQGLPLWRRLMVIAGQWLIETGYDVRSRFENNTQ